MSTTTIKCTECGSTNIDRVQGETFKCKDCGAMFLRGLSGARSEKWERQPVNVPDKSDTNSVITVWEDFGWEFESQKFVGKLVFKRNTKHPAYNQLVSLQSDYDMLNLREDASLPPKPPKPYVSGIVASLLWLVVLVSLISFLSSVILNGYEFGRVIYDYLALFIPFTIAAIPFTVVALRKILYLREFNYVKAIYDEGNEIRKQARMLL